MISAWGCARFVVGAVVRGRDERVFSDLKFLQVVENATDALVKGVIMAVGLCPAWASPSPRRFRIRNLGATPEHLAASLLAWGMVREIEKEGLSFLLIHERASSARGHGCNRPAWWRLRQ